MPGNRLRAMSQHCLRGKEGGSTESHPGLTGSHKNSECFAHLATLSVEAALQLQAQRSRQSLQWLKPITWLVSFLRFIMCHLVEAPFLHLPLLLFLH